MLYTAHFFTKINFLVLLAINDLVSNAKIDYCKRMKLFALI